jgi:iron complex outermembrane receptor protein
MFLAYPTATTKSNHRTRTDPWEPVMGGRCRLRCPHLRVGMDSHLLRIARLLVVALTALSIPGAALAQTPDLALATLEELMNIRVTSAGKKEQRAEDVAAAVYVVTQDEIRRSGLTTLPEILRLVPGMQVAQISANKSAVSIRGFNDVFSNKLLVLIDGRSLYNRAFSGVLWDAQDLMVSDIERIEVIRGPGGATWGANAVNGVINIITRSAAQTPGTAVEASVGTFESGRVSARYGGAVGRMAYRVYSQFTDTGDTVSHVGAPISDHGKNLVGGVRIDWARGPDEVMAQSRVMTGTNRPMWLELSGPSPDMPPATPRPSDIDEVMVLGKWTRTMPDRSIFSLQAFNTNTYRDEATLSNVERTSDVEAQYETRLGSRHDLVLGGGVRHASFSSRPTFTLNIASDDNVVFNTFVQDEITLGKGVAVTLGSKLEHDTTAGWGLLPSARVLWQAPGNQRVWAAIARARRTPSLIDRTLRINYAAVASEPLPLLLGWLGNPDYLSEQFLQTEVGYRIRLGANAGIDVTAFRGHYSDLQTLEPLAPAFEATPGPPHLFIGSQFGNLLQLDTRGLEISAHWSPIRDWRFDGSYSTIHFSPRPEPGTLDLAAATVDGNAPRHQWQLHSSAWLTSRIQVDGAVYYVGRLRQLEIPAYTRVDIRGEVLLTKPLALIVVGQNLLDRVHQEYWIGAATSSGIARSGRLELRWRF